MEEIKRHCEKIIRILRSDYNTQLQYSGIIKKIYDVMLQIYGVHVEQQKRDTIDENGIPAL